MHERPKAARDVPASDMPASDRMATRVLVVGAGPVGLTLAMDLATRGISVTVVEIRSAGKPPSVKCNHVSSRSMEIFRRLGLAHKLRDTGLPPDYPNDCSYRTAPRQPASSFRAYKSPAGAIAIPPAVDRTLAGRRPSRRIGSTRSTWNRCFSPMPPPSTGFRF